MLLQLTGRAGRAVASHVEVRLGGATRARVVVVLACVLGLSGADFATVGASATELRSGLGITNTDIGLLVAVSSLVAALATMPFGVLADRVRRTWTLGGAIALWSIAMFWSAIVTNFNELLLSRLFLGVVTAAAGPLVASLVGDYFPAAERGRIYGYILAGELLGAGFGFAVTGDIATISWRAAFVVLAVPAVVLAWFVIRLPEPPRGGTAPLESINPQPAVEDEGKPSDAQQLAREHGIEPDPGLVLRKESVSFAGAVSHVLRVRTNLVLIAASACGYYFLAGIQTFGSEFAKEQYRINQAFANVLLLLVGGGAVVGVLAGGFFGDWLVRKRYLKGRILVSVISATGATVLFVPALFARTAWGALPSLALAAMALSAQNPPLDAARLDIMPAQLWGRAEAIRTVLRGVAQALAPLLFGVVSDHVFGGGRMGLQLTFVVMLLPLAGSAALLYRALDTYPRDVASAAASADATDEWSWDDHR